MTWSAGNVRGRLEDLDNAIGNLEHNYLRAREALYAAADALAFYADFNNYVARNDVEFGSIVASDGGEQAKSALEKARRFLNG